MYDQEFKVKGVVEIFPMENPWHYVSVPKKYTEMFKHDMVRGLLPIKAQLGKSSWDTSLLPKGDGTHFIALSKKIRKAENIELGDSIQLVFKLRV